ncbi:MAG TPA: 30S ribosomal protein S9 [Pirellulales bacterium]|nr:30S ribosomal protein S9 [Pirellulales bacterium]
MSIGEQPALRHGTEALGTGRRKTSVARVRVRAGQGNITINGRPLQDYFVNEHERKDVLVCLDKTERRDSIDLTISVQGGGTTGQAGACKMGIARALKIFDPTLEPILRANSLLTRDSRMKERKKYGLRGARRGTQFSKR